MAENIDFHFPKPSDDVENVKEFEKFYNILSDYLQPDCTKFQQQAIEEIVQLLPDPPLTTGTNVHESFWEVCVAMAEQIPYWHPSQIKFARLIVSLSSMRSMVNTEGAYKTEDLKRLLPMHCPLGLSRKAREFGRDDVSITKKEEIGPFVNKNAFFALLSAHGVDSWNWKHIGLWSIRKALEESESEDGRNRRIALVAGAAMWILYDGMTQFRLCQIPPQVPPNPSRIASEDKSVWNGHPTPHVVDTPHLGETWPETLWEKEAVIDSSGNQEQGGDKKKWWSVQRWEFWRSRFEALGEGGDWVKKEDGDLKKEDEGPEQDPHSVSVEDGMKLDLKKEDEGPEKDPHSVLVGNAMDLARKAAVLMKAIEGSQVSRK